MSIDWSNRTPEILLQLRRDGAESLGSQVQNALRSAVREGRLGEGERLPSSRRLAADLGLSRGLVQSAYEQLEAEGYLRGHAGSSTRVAFSPPAEVTTSRVQGTVTELEVDFLPGRPDLNSFPFRDWSWAYSEACRITSGRELGYEDPAGAPRLRDVLASYLRRVRGSATSGDELIVCNGFTQGAALALNALRLAGATTVAVEDPGHLDMPQLVRRAGLRPVPVRVDGRGLVVDHLARTAATAVIVTPAHQTPTGVVLDPERRRVLIEWANRVNGYVIEDEYDSEFRYDKHAVGSLQGLASDRVLSIGSVSKTLAPGVRIGWLATPRDLREAIVEEKLRSDRGSPKLDQIALARLMESGRFDRHLRRMRTLYRLRRQALVKAIEGYAPGIELTGLAAGFHALARLPSGRDEDEIVEAARRRSVGLHGLSQYRSSGSTGAQALVIGFGDVTEDQIERGIRILGDIMR